jgi:hypothetical protein
MALSVPMKKILEHVVSGEELKALIEQGKTLKEVSELAFERCGQKWSTAGVSKLCKKHKIQMPRSGPRSGSLHKGWKGGRTVNKDGYVEVYSPGHPQAKKHTHYILEHRLVMEEYLGRFLLRKEVVHHKNGVKTDNRTKNLEVFESNAKHLAETLKGQKPCWSEEGKKRILEGQKNKGKINLSAESKLLRRSLCLLRNAIQRELKLDVPPNTETSHRFLESLGMSWQQSLQMVVTHGIESVFPRPKQEHESCL